MNGQRIALILAAVALFVAGLVWWSPWSSSESMAAAIAESLDRNGDCLDTPRQEVDFRSEVRAVQSAAPQASGSVQISCTAGGPVLVLLSFESGGQAREAGAAFKTKWCLAGSDIIAPAKGTASDSAARVACSAVVGDWLG